MPVLSPTPALDAYETLAPHYDLFTQGHDHRTWLRRLEALARRHGLAGRTVLDLACGTGKSLAPLIELGYRGTGCDLSPAMLARARRRLPGVLLCEADLRDLPPLGRFDWVTCLDDALNYLVEDGDLHAALRGMAGVLAPDGLVTFDLNTRAAHRDGFADTWEVAGVRWWGRGCDGAVGIADIEAGGRTSRHVQRWWSAGEVAEAAAAAGLEVAGAYGQTPGAVMHDRPDEERCTKTVFVLRHVKGGAG